MIRKYPFHSFLKNNLAAYLDFKFALGYTTFGASGSILSVAKALDQYVLFHGLATLDQITEAVIFNWIHANRQHAAGTRNRHLFFARTFFDFLRRRALVSHNPARRVPELKRKSYRPYIFTLKELQGLLAQAQHLQNPSALFPQTFDTAFHLLYAGALRCAFRSN